LALFEKAKELSCLLQKKSITATAVKPAAEAIVANYRKLKRRCELPTLLD